MRRLKVGFYEELDELRKDYGEADFGFLENEKVTKEDYAFDFLHGSCDEFAAMLNEMYGYPIECVRYPGDETLEGKLIHAYCVTDLHGEKAYIDIRGITTDPVLFYEEFENELTYFPEDGSIYTLNDEGYEVKAKLEHWDNKEVLFDGDYEGWTDEEIKGFILEHREYYDISRIREKDIALKESESVYYHVTLMENVPSIRNSGLLPQIGERSEELGETEEAIYLFPSKEDMDNALMNWLGEWYNEEYGEDCDLAILEVRLPEEISLIDEGVGYEVVCKEKIPAECIRYFDEMGKELDNERSHFRVMKPEEIGDIFHVGTMDLSQKSEFSYEGNGLSISNCPDVWCRITEGHTHGDCFQLIKSDMKLLDYYGLTEAEKQEIQEWAIKEGYAVPGKLYKSIFYGEEGEEYFSLYDSFDAAMEEADYEEECIKEVAGLLPTEKLLGQSLVEVELLDMPDIITELYAEQVLGYDGVYWDEVLDEMSYSAPRGVIFNDRIHDFQVVNLTEKERASGLDGKIQEAKRNMVRCSSDKEREMLR